jgi:hypothetical protein
MGDAGHKFALQNLLGADAPQDGGLKEDEGVYLSAPLACGACVKQLIDTRSCKAFAENACFAMNSKVGFGAKTVESVKDGKLGTEVVDNDESLDEQWSYVISTPAEGGVPEGSESCGKVLFKADPNNASATDAQVEAACASQGKPFCSAQVSKFEKCCAGFVPENILCDDGKHCCGKENTVTIDAKGDECEAKAE